MDYLGSESFMLSHMKVAQEVCRLRCAQKWPEGLVNAIILGTRKQMSWVGVGEQEEDPRGEVEEEPQEEDLEERSRLQRRKRMF